MDNERINYTNLNPWREIPIGKAVFVVRKGFMTCDTPEPCAYFSRRSKAEDFIALERQFWRGGVSQNGPIYDIQIIELDVWGLK